MPLNCSECPLESKSFHCLDETYYRLLDRAHELHIHIIPKDRKSKM